MGKDQDLLQAVKDQDSVLVRKILTKAARQNKKLLGSSKRLNINYQDDVGMSCLHQAALMGNTAIMHALLEHGTSVSLRDNKGMIALHYAAWQGKPDPVFLLLKHGSPVNEKALDCETPLHLAAQHGHYNVVNLLLGQQANLGLENKTSKTPMDLACEFGRIRVVELLLSQNSCQKMLSDSRLDLRDNRRTTGLHLAAKNGHTDVIKTLLDAGMDINRTTLKGTCLHEAAMYGKTNVVKLLLDRGADVNKPNSYDQTALDIVNKFTAARAGKDLKHLLWEASLAVSARAVKDFSNKNDPHCISFKEGDHITVLEQRPDGRWKGHVMNNGQPAKVGYFPCEAVVLVDSSVQPSRCSCGLYIYETLSQSAPSLINAVGNHHQYNGVLHHPVPDLLHRAPSTNGHSNRSSYGSIGADDNFPPPPSPLVAKRTAHQENCAANQNHIHHNHNHNHHHHHHHHGTHRQPEHFGGRLAHSQTADHVDWVGCYVNGPVVGGEMRPTSPSPKESPTGSNRNSAASSDSGRGVSTGHVDSKQTSPNFVNVHINNVSQHRLSGQSYESGVSSRQSYHSTSSGSSIGSLDHLEESGYSSQINVAELVQAGVPNHEVLLTWLAELHFEEYFKNFMQAGYDMPTISRMTPEDLTAIGITKPAHRKKLKSEIAKLHIYDGIPEYKPEDVLEWLQVLCLDQYYSILMDQGFDSMENVTDITWEDLEDIGINLLGHQKKIILAVDRLKRINSGIKRLSNTDYRNDSASEYMESPSILWNSDLPPGPQYSHEVSITTIKHKKSPSGDNLNTICSGSELRTFQQPKESDMMQNLLDYGHIRQGSGSRRYQPDVVGNSLDSGHRPTSPDVLDGNGDHRQLTPNKIAVKPKPVAKIVAKRKFSNRDYSPEIIELSSSGGSRDSSGGSRDSTPTNNDDSCANSSSLKREQNQTPVKEHVYDQPVLSPNSLKQQQNFMFPSQNSPTVLTENASATSSPLHIMSHYETDHQPMHSPSHRKVPPPPPPKRVNSVSSSPYSESKPRTSTLERQKKQFPSSPAHNNGCAAYTSCVMSLHEKFGVPKDDAGFDDSQEDTPTSSDSEEFPPPPPVAMHIMTPKIHSHGIFKAGKVTSRDSPERLFNRDSPERFNFNRSTDSPEKIVLPLKDKVQKYTPPPPIKPKPSPHHTDAPIKPHFAEPMRHQYHNSPRHASVSNDTEAQNSPRHAPAMTNHSDAQNSPRHGPSLTNHSEASRHGPAMTNHNEVPINGAPVHYNSPQSHNSPHKSHGDSPKPELLVKPQRPDIATKPVNKQLAKFQAADWPPSTPVQHENNTSTMVKRHVSPVRLLDSTISTSTQSIDSNTLPFANENVGTIKQKAPSSKPSIVEMSQSWNNDVVDGENHHMYNNVDGVNRTSENHNAWSTTAPDHYYTQAPNEKWSKSHDYAGAMPAGYAADDNFTLKARPSETGDVLNDIDNMLQDLTDELDAMLDLEISED